MKSGSEDRYVFIGHELGEASYSYALLSRVTQKDRKIGRTVGSSHVYVHECVAEERRTAIRSDRIRSTHSER